MVNCIEPYLLDYDHIPQTALLKGYTEVWDTIEWSASTIKRVYSVKCAQSYSAALG